MAVAYVGAWVLLDADSPRRARLCGRRRRHGRRAGGRAPSPRAAVRLPAHRVLRRHRSHADHGQVVLGPGHLRPLARARRADRGAARRRRPARRRRLDRQDACRRGDRRRAHQRPGPDAGRGVLDRRRARRRADPRGDPRGGEGEACPEHDGAVARGYAASTSASAPSRRCASVAASPTRARSCPWSATTAPARARSSRSCPACSRPTRGSLTIDGERPSSSAPPARLATPVS